MTFPLVTRDEWDARPATEELEPLEPQIERVVFTLDEGWTPACKTIEDCLKSVKLLQTHYMDERKMPDIPYNFIVGNDGRIYEGRGWHQKPQKSKTNDNLKDKVIEIGIITGHVNEPINKRSKLEIESMDIASKFIIEEGVKKYIVSEYFDFVGFTDQYIL